MKKLFAEIKALFVNDGTEKTTLQKQLKWILIFVCAVIIGLIIYFAAIYPSVSAQNQPTPLLEGEAYYSGTTSVLLVPYTARSEMTSIDVHNAYEDYTLVSYTASDGSVSFYIKDNEHITLNAQNLSQAVVGAGLVYASSVNSIPRINEAATEADLASYGLAETSENRAWFCVHRVDGTSYRIYIGDMIPSGNAYYAMVEGRETIVYAVSATNAYIFVNRSTVLVDTMIAEYLGTSITSVADYYLFRQIDGERELILRTASTTDESSSQSFDMLYPEGYYLNEDLFSSSVLDNLLYVSAAEILAYGDDIVDPDVYSQYGLDLDMDRIASGTDLNYALLYYSCVVPDDDTGESCTIENLLYFSKSYMDTDGGTYYNVYSPAFDVIAKLDAETFAFVDWNIASYTSNRMFYDYIGTCNYFELTDYLLERSYRFSFTGTERNYHVDVTTAGENGTVILGEDGKPRVFDVEYIHDDYGGEYEGEFENFRQLYLDLITRTFDLTQEAASFDVDDEPALTVSVSTTPRDLASSYGLYDEDGERLRNSSGSQIYVRYRGGYLICSDATATPKAGGTALTYATLYYDADTGRFFQKKVDSNDGELKPVSMGYDDNYNSVIERYIPASYTVEATYDETISTYNFYYVYETYTDANGKEVKVINQSLMVVVPTITDITYKVSTESGISEVSRKTTVAEMGMVMRKTAIDKLFADCESVLAGEEIDGYDAN